MCLFLSRIIITVLIVFIVKISIGSGKPCDEYEEAQKRMENQTISVFPPTMQELIQTDITKPGETNRPNRPEIAGKINRTSEQTEDDSQPVITDNDSFEVPDFIKAGFNSGQPDIFNQNMYTKPIPVDYFPRRPPYSFSPAVGVFPTSMPPYLLYGVPSSYGTGTGQFPQLPPYGLQGSYGTDTGQLPLYGLQNSYGTGTGQLPPYGLQNSYGTGTGQLLPQSVPSFNPSSSTILIDNVYMALNSNSQPVDHRIVKRNVPDTNPAQINPLVGHPRLYQPSPSDAIHLSPIIHKLMNPDVLTHTHPFDQTFPSLQRSPIYQLTQTNYHPIKSVPTLGTFRTATAPTPQPIRPIDIRALAEPFLGPNYDRSQIAITFLNMIYDRLIGLLDIQNI